MEYGIVAVVYWLSAIPTYLYFSTLITVIHTAEEAYGEIWNYLHVPSWLYFAFQLGVVVLGASAIVTHQWVYVFIAVRVGDVVLTHLILQAPGKWTSPLLLLDAFIVYRSIDA